MKIFLSRDDFVLEQTWHDLCDALDLEPQEPNGKYPDVVEFEVSNGQPMLVE